MVDLKPSRARLAVLVMLFVTVVITYLDRANLSIAAPAMRRELGIDTVHMGIVLSAFGWTYAFCQLPGGWLAGRVPPRFLYPGLLFFWSAATFLLGLSAGLAILLCARCLIGALEAPSYSINNQVVTAWFPTAERGGAVGFYTSGQFVGLAFLTPLLLWIEAGLGWRSVFLLTGGLGAVWAAIWLLVYRGPRHFAWANKAEVALIADGGGLVDLDAQTRALPARPTLAEIREVFRWRKLWGVYLGQFAVTSSQWFFLTWFPSYLIDYRHLSYVTSGLYAAVPFLGGFLGVLGSGLLSDWLLRRGISLGWARKGPIIAGLLLSCTIMGANFVAAPQLVILFMTLAFFGSGMASISWSLISSLAPRGLIGLTGGAFNFISNLSAIASPLVIGFLARGGNFAPGLVYIASVAALGAGCYIFLIGKVEQVGNA